MFQQREKFGRVFNLFCEATNVSPTGLSRELFGRSNKVSRMESLEESVNVHILEKASQYLSDNWPEDLEWPEDIERPPAKELAE